MVANVLKQMSTRMATEGSPWELEWAPYGAPAPPTLRIRAEQLTSDLRDPFRTQQFRPERFKHGSTKSETNR
ncbi:hypothetical protein Y032_0101g3344 [Ancylostoma ceylanicum]|uniref:Uncharacterized protein n=1 Tax=Ancylostoma ceylanicum TaxID=53326 RepID=A0A016THP6_9BILA|nr:hypothetical protein Y032_0101g3344 [Ancylostoma ceylanicum]